MSDQIVWKTRREEVSRDVIAEVERIFGVRFPEDYIECAKKYHGGYPNRDFFPLDEKNNATFNRLLNFNKDNSSYIVKVFQDIRDRLVDHVYPFASDDFGNFICFDYRKNKENPTIAFWDHEDAFLNKETGVSYICDSFNEFLAKLRPYEG